MKKSRVEFIKQAHMAACSDWKNKIEQEFPKLFTTDIKEGDWVTNGNGKTLFIYKEETDRTGFDYNGRWINIIGRACDNNLKPATKKEVKEALLNEAKKRGFKAGVKHTNAYNNQSGIYKARGKVIYGYKGRCNLHFSEGMGIIYENGVWAEIIEEPVKKELTVAEIEEKLGYGVKIVK